MRRASPVLLSIFLVLAVQLAAKPAPAGKAEVGDTSSDSLAMAHLLMKDHRYSEALPYLDNAIRFNPQLTSAYLSRTRAHLRLEQYEKAMADANRALELDPGNIPALGLRGSAREALGAKKEAQQDFLAVLQSPAKTADDYFEQCMAHGALAAMQSGSSDFGKEKEHYLLAIKAADAALQLDPAFAAAYRERGRSKFWHALLSAASRVGEKFTMKTEIFRPALDDLNMALKLDPRDKNTYLARADVGLFWSWDRQVADYSAAIALDPTDANAFLGRGQVLARQDKAEQALQDLSTAIELSDSAAAREARASVYKAIGNDAAAKLDEAAAAKLGATAADLAPAK